MLLILILFLIFGGFGGGYYGYNNGWGPSSPPNCPPDQVRRQWVGPGTWGAGTPVIFIIIVVWLLLGSGRF